MTVIIAEAGVNHNGDEQLAMRLVEAAAKAGADIVKFQTFKASKLATDCAQQATYQKKTLVDPSRSKQCCLVWSLVLELISVSSKSVGR